MKVKIDIPCVDAAGHGMTLSLDADLKAPILETKDGVVYLRALNNCPIRVDCMPDIRKE